MDATKAVPQTRGIVCVMRFCFRTRGSLVEGALDERTPARLGASPVSALVRNDAIGPRAEVRGILKPPDAPGDRKPRFLRRVGSSLGVASQVPCVGMEAHLPTDDERLEGISLAILATNDQ